MIPSQDQCFSAKNANERCRARTCDPLIKSQLPKNGNSSIANNLESDTKTTYTPAYKECQKTEVTGTALPTQYPENPLIDVLVGVLATFSNQKRAEIISELPKEQRYTIVRMIADRLTRSQTEEL